MLKIYKTRKYERKYENIKTKRIHRESAKEKDEVKDEGRDDVYERMGNSAIRKEKGKETYRSCVTRVFASSRGT